MRRYYLLAFFLFWTQSHMASGLVVAAIPKSGTHQIKKLIELLIDGSQHLQIPKEKDFFVKLYPEFLEKIKGNFYHLGHHIGIKENRHLALKKELRVILSLRDPRNQIVSFARQRRYQFNGMSLNNIITLMIQNPGSYWKKNSGWLHPEVMKVNSLVDFYDLYLQWLNYPFIHVVRFEDIVGPNGGGSDSRQLSEIKKIADFLGVSLDDDDIDGIASKLWGGTHTFSGRTSDWKNYFTEQHKQLFKDLAGQLLIDLGYEIDFNW